jgi:predicted dehydrogenase
VGFVGLGWIGRNRLQAITEAEVLDVAGLFDESEVAVANARELAPQALVACSLDELLSTDLDGVVIATPNSLHAEQTIKALEKGIAVFCQKPLCRTAEEVERVVEAARKADRLLGVDLSYRFISGMRTVNELATSGELGTVFAVDVKFYNGYGPDKRWFYDRQFAGGGCVLDLGCHLLDLALRPFDYPKAKTVHSSLFRNGHLLPKPCTEIEDFAVANITLTNGVVVNLACLWNSHIGADARIEVAFHGSKASAGLRNVNGSFYDFRAEHFQGTQRTDLSSSQDANWQWGGLAALDWCERLATDHRFDSEIEKQKVVAEVIDLIYGREGGLN